jgi:8-oxo-dGTP diphosphatase
LAEQRRERPPGSGLRPVRATLCHVLNEERLLLKRATRGVSLGKWNAPGGKIERGENPEENARREVLEETGLVLGETNFHGRIAYEMGSGDPRLIRVFLFSARSFTGRLRSTDEGVVRWFHVSRLPLDEMWDDDRYWVHLMLNGCRFDARFSYDKENRWVEKFEIRSRAEAEKGEGGRIRPSRCLGDRGVS